MTMTVRNARRLADAIRAMSQPDAATGKPLHKLPSLVRQRFAAKAIRLRPTEEAFDAAKKALMLDLGMQSDDQQNNPKRYTAFDHQLAELLDAPAEGLDLGKPITVAELDLDKNDITPALLAELAPILDGIPTE